MHEVFERYYPDAEFIFVVRHPFAVISSMRKLRFERENGENWIDRYAEKEVRSMSTVDPEALAGIENLTNPRLGARVWRLNCEAIEKAEQRGLNTTVIRFEDLMTNTESELKRVTERIGLQYEAQMLNYHERKENGGRVLAGGTRGDRELDPSRGAPEIRLTEEEKEEIVEESMPWIEEYSYL